MAARFTVRGALLEGGNLIRRRPMLLVTWTLLFLCLSVIAAGIAQVQDDMLRAQIAAGKSPNTIGPPYALLGLEAVISLMFSSIVWASAFQALLRPEVRRPIGFGKAVLMVLAVRLVTQLAATLPLALLPLLAVYVRGSAILSVTGPVATAIGILGVLWSAVASVWAFDKLKFAPFRSWAVAKGHFWPFAVVFVLVALIIQMIGATVRTAALYLPHTGLLPTRPGLANLASAPILAQMVAAAVLVALEIALLAGITAHAYKASERP